MTSAVAPPAAAPLGVERLVVVTNVTHYRHEGRVWAYGPYAREIGAWTTLFPRVAIAAPERLEAPPADALPIDGPDVRVVPQLEVGGTTVASKLRLVAALPATVWRLARALRGADAVHVRCPGNLGLLGAVLAPLLVRRRVAKYAGQWSGFPGEEWTVRLQRAILRSRWWGAPVLAYTGSSGEPAHVVPFFSTAVSGEQVAAIAPRDGRAPGDDLRVLFVGRLSRNKNVHLLLGALATLRAEGVAVRGTVVGDGAERAPLERLAAELGLGPAVEFAGAVGVDDVLAHYRRADVLVLPSTTEGWPKVLVEAMTFGLVCIGPDCGVVPTILAGGRGLVLPALTADALAATLRSVVEHREELAAAGASAATWARRYTLEGFAVSLRDVLADAWRIDAPARVGLRPGAHGV